MGRIGSILFPNIWNILKRSSQSISKKTVAISGGFDPLHVGHIRYIQDAARLGRLIVILNSDRFLLDKKGYVFMPFEERVEMLRAIKGVDEVFPCIDLDDTVCKSLMVVRPDIFAKGGDRKLHNIPEVDTCNECKIKMVFGIGGSDKPNSSSWLIEKFVAALKKDKELRKRYGMR